MLNEKQRRFAEEYTVDLNATQAAIRAGYSKATAGAQGHDLLKNPEIQAHIADVTAKRSEKTGVTAEKVLEELWAIAHADPNELIEYRRSCCRYCHGKDFRYQRTPREFEEYEAAQFKVVGFDRDLVDPQGGVGWDIRKPPHPDCPECFGEGVERAFPKDTRFLTPAASKLYAGVKITKDGLEVKMHDKIAALTKVAQHLGMFTERFEGKVDGGLIINIKRFDD